jgi:tRNA-dihydrouridine synthase
MSGVMMRMMMTSYWLLGEAWRWSEMINAEIEIMKSKETI